MKLTQLKSLIKLSLGLVIACILIPSFGYAAKPFKLFNDFEDSWLNDFKCAVEIGSGLFPLFDQESYIPLNGGICVGYYFL